MLRGTSRGHIGSSNRGQENTPHKWLQNRRLGNAPYWRISGLQGHKDASMPKIHTDREVNQNYRVVYS
jgi:hypothetical protein